jgi:hypothetical protein
MPTTVNENDERRIQRRVHVCPVPTNVLTNASYELTYTAGSLTQLDMTVDGVTYRRTFDFTASPATISTWSVV